VIARAARSSAATAMRKRGGALRTAECQPAHPNGVLAWGERDFPGQCGRAGWNAEWPLISLPQITGADPVPEPDRGNIANKMSEAVRTKRRWTRK
jgi:hypothetical protein